MTRMKWIRKSIREREKERDDRTKIMSIPKEIEFLLENNNFWHAIRDIFALSLIAFRLINIYVRIVRSIFRSYFHVLCVVFVSYGLQFRKKRKNNARSRSNKLETVQNKTKQ